MGSLNIRMPAALGLGLMVSLFAAAFRLFHGLPAFLYLLPLLAALIGFLVLAGWRHEAGEQELLPVCAYALLVLCSYFLFGVVYAPYGISALPAVLAAALLMPAISEFALERGRFKSENSFLDTEAHAPADS